MKNVKFATKILIIILGISIISIIAISAISYRELLNLASYSRDANTYLGITASRESSAALTDQAKYYMEMLAVARAAEVSEILKQVQNAVEGMAGYVTALFRFAYLFPGRFVPEYAEGTQPAAKMQFTSNTQTFTERHQEEMLLLGHAELMFSHVFAANQPYMTNAYLGSFSGFHFRWSDSNARIDDDTFVTYERPWFLLATYEDNLGRAVWHNIRPCGITGRLLATCTMAFFDAEGNVAGAVATDVLIQILTDDIAGFTIGETGFAFLLDNTGRYIAHREYGGVGTAPDMDALSAIEGATGDYAEVLQRMIRQETGIQTVTGTGAADIRHYIAFAPVDITGWSLGIVVESAEIVAPAEAMADYITIMTIAMWESIDDNITSVMFRLIILSSIVTIANVFFAIVVSGSVTKPIMKLTRGVIEVGKGDLAKKIDIDTADEVGILAKNFNKMTDDLTDYISTLSKVTAENERISTELNIATQIQADMLPSIFPAFPERKEFDIYATMVPAKEVGGDFYDFFIIDQNKLAVVIADVSDKGVPAALFMVIAKTLIKNYTQIGKPPLEVFGIVNNILCENNESCMFVTAFMGILDIPSGLFTYANAGHNPPLIKRAGGDYAWLPTNPGLVLAGMEGVIYEQDEIKLKAGDTVFFYTDGITEAHNPALALFTEEKLLEAAQRYQHLSIYDFLAQIKTEVDAFAGGAVQADDITMLALRISDTQRELEKKSLALPAIIENWAHVSCFIKEGLIPYGLSADDINLILIATEEVFANIAHYAYAPQTGDAEVGYTFANGRLTVELIDSGTPYNPLEREDPDITLDLHEREIGGLGVYLVKDLMDSVEYTHREGKNILRFLKHFPQSD